MIMGMPDGACRWMHSLDHGQNKVKGKYHGDVFGLL